MKEKAVSKILFWRRRREELDEEINSHLQMAVSERIARGESSEDAKISALKEIGNIRMIKEVTREGWVLMWLERLMQDLRYSLFVMSKRLGFTSLVVMTLALGIGSATAIFSIIDGVLLQPLPFARPDRIVRIDQLAPGSSSSVTGPRGAAFGDYIDWKSKNRVFTDLSVFQNSSATITSDGDAELLTTARVDSEFFHLLKVDPAIGRHIQPSEDSFDSEKVVLLSDKLWKSRFGADRSIIGRTIILDQVSYRVIGVMPAGFDFPDKSDVWTNLQVNPQFQGRQFPFFTAIATLKDGVSINQAQADMNSIANGLAQAFPDTNKDRTIVVTDWHAQAVKEVRPSILILGGAALLLLLVSVANVTNLLLTNTSQKQREIAVRSALGASRFRLVLQLLCESLVLTGCGGAVGVLLSFWATAAIIKLSPVDIPYLDRVGVNGRVLLFAVLLTIVTGIIAGLWPIVTALKINLNDALRQTGSNFANGLKQQRLRNLLVVAELSLTLILLVSAGLLMRSFRSVITVNPGYVPEHVLTLNINLPSSKFALPSQFGQFSEDLASRVGQVRGVNSAACVFRLPQERSIPVEVKAGPSDRQTVQAEINSMGPDYPQTMGIPLLKGRAFTKFDTTTSAKVVVLSEGLANRLWPKDEAVGKRVYLSGDDPIEVVGVIGDTRSVGLDSKPKLQIYYPNLQFPSNSVRLVVRTEGESQNLIPALRAVIKETDNTIHSQEISTMEEQLSKAVTAPRFYAVLMGVFSGIAILLALVGLYGVISRTVTLRTQEIGVRTALGAQRKDILKLVAGQGLWMTLIGVGIGLGGAVLATPLLRGLLFGITPTDPVTFLGVAMLLVIVAALACYIPASRATKIDPMIALRYE